MWVLLNGILDVNCFKLRYCSIGDWFLARSRCFDSSRFNESLGVELVEQLSAALGFTEIPVATSCPNGVVVCDPPGPKREIPRDCCYVAGWTSVAPQNCMPYETHGQASVANIY